MVATVLIAVVVGAAIGVLSGLLGIGGGTVMVPAFRLAFGMSPLVSTATSLFTIIPTSVSGAVSHVRGRTCVPKLGVTLGVGGAVASPLGVWLAQVSPGWLVMGVAALVIAYSALNMLSKALKVSGRKKSVDEAAVPTLSEKRLLQSGAIGVLAGVVSGYIGVGGGFIMVPLMVSVLNMPMRLASGTSLIAVMILAVPGAVVQCLLGNVDYLVAAAVACGSIPGAMAGARLVSRVPERALRFAFAAFLCIAAVLLVVKEMVA